MCPGVALVDVVAPATLLYCLVRLPVKGWAVITVVVLTYSAVVLARRRELRSRKLSALRRFASAVVVSSGGSGWSAASDNG